MKAQLTLGMTPGISQVGQAAGGQVVNDVDFPFLRQKAIHQAGTDKTCTTRHNGSQAPTSP